MQPTQKIVGLINRVIMGDSKTKIILTPVVAIIYLCLISVFILLAFIIDKLFHFPPASLYPWNLCGAIPLFTFGFILMVFSVIYFFKAKGTPVPLNPPRTLIQVGPYRDVRNPMLTGVFLLMLALGFYNNSISLIFIFTPFFIILNYFELKYIEEPELEMRFGQQYQEYKQNTPMFLPKIQMVK